MKMKISTLNILGMVMNLVGFILLFFFGAPFIPRTGGKSVLLLNSSDPHAIQMERLYDGIGLFALLLAIAGTICQILAERRRAAKMRD